jgi:hypothetical protein
MPTTLDVIFNGVQKIPGYPDQWVFTERLSGSTFYTSVGITYDHLVREVARVQGRFGWPAANKREILDDASVAP